MKIKNKKTGEIIDLSVKATEKPKPETKQEATETRIEKRGKIQDSAKKLESPSMVQKAIGGLEIAAAPLAAVESSLANPAIAIQGGEKNPMELTRQAILGLTLQRQGQYGDVMKNAGFNPLLSDTAGLLVNVAPVQVINGAAKTFGNISKMSDKGLMKAGTKLIDAANEARNAVGKMVGNEYAKQADKIGVDGLKFLNDISDIPKPVLNKLELAFGDMTQFAQGLTIGKLREFKSYLGKLKPNSFGQAEHGIQESLDVKDLNKAYGNLKNRMKESMADAKLEKKVVDHLINLDDTYSRVMDARRYIKKKIVDPTLNTPSRAGIFSQEVLHGADVTPRIALNEIKKASSDAMRDINKAMGEIQSFDRWQKGKQIASAGVRAAAFGGIAGGIGGAILRKAQGRESNG